MRPKAFEDAVLDFVSAISEAEANCAARLALLPDEDWEAARSTLQSWLKGDSPKSINWRQIIEMAEHQRSAHD